MPTRKSKPRRYIATIERQVWQQVKVVITATNLERAHVKAEKLCEELADDEELEWEDLGPDPESVFVADLEPEPSRIIDKLEELGRPAVLIELSEFLSMKKELLREELWRLRDRGDIFIDENWQISLPKERT